MPFRGKRQRENIYLIGHSPHFQCDTAVVVAATHNFRLVVDLHFSPASLSGTAPFSNMFVIASFSQWRQTETVPNTEPFLFLSDTVSTTAAVLFVSLVCLTLYWKFRLTPGASCAGSESDMQNACLFGVSQCPETIY